MDAYAAAPITQSNEVLGPNTSFRLSFVFFVSISVLPTNSASNICLVFNQLLRFFLSHSCSLRDLRNTVLEQTRELIVLRKHGSCDTNRTSYMGSIYSLTSRAPFERRLMDFWIETAQHDSAAFGSQLPFQQIKRPDGANAKRFNTREVD